MSQELLLDGSKLAWHQERLEAWRRGERIAPITIDMALTDKCNYACRYCYAELQGNKGFRITKDHMKDFLDDCKEIGVKAVSLVSDGESSISPAYAYSIQYGHSIGLDMASGSNGYIHNEKLFREILPCLTYFRVNITAGEPERYKEIMGVRDGWFERVCENIRTAVRIKQELNLGVTIGMQAVLMPEFRDQIIPLAALGKALRPDYLVLKHCSDDEQGSLGMDYSGYDGEFIRLLEQAETYSDETYKVVPKWNKIKEGNRRQYQRCYGTPFHLQISGSGLVAPCGMLFGEKYKQYHIANITKERFRDTVKSDRYWEVINFLASEKFNAQKMCGSLCLQHHHNTLLDKERKGELRLALPSGKTPTHINFI